MSSSSEAWRGAHPSRLPAVVFAILIAATVGAFFITQHLKVQNPFINGLPRPDPPAINPIAGRVCKDLAGQRVSYKIARVSFYLQTSAQKVDVFVENGEGQVVATARGSGRYVRPGPTHRVSYSWNGKVPSGAVAPDGSYHFVVSLPAEDRTVPAGGSFQVITVPRQPQVTSVTATGVRAGSVPIISAAAGQSATIRFTAGDYRDAHVEIIRTDLPTGPRTVFAFTVNGHSGKAVWDGKIRGAPAPAGTYLVGLRVTDQACNVSHFPIVADPQPGATPHAGVTVRYLAAQPPSVPVAAGTTATVFVDSRRRAYDWKLFAAGRPKVLEHGSVGAAAAGTPAGVDLRVPIPPLGAAVYELALRSGSHRTVVPLIAAAGGRRAAAKVLVVLPALTWEGRNPVDDTGDGLPATLAAGDQINLDRPLVDGLPAGLPGELGVLHFLQRQHDGFQLTTDVALAEGVGPPLAGRTGVILDGSLEWLPSSLYSRLRSFVETGGRAVSIGTHSMQAQAPLQSGSSSSGPAAGPPRPLPRDPFGARHGTLVSHTGALITVGAHDPLGIFTTTPTFQNFSSYQQISPPPGTAASEAGVATGLPAIAGFRLGAGKVVEIGLEGFGVRLAGDVDAQDLLARLWRLLAP